MPLNFRINKQNTKINHNIPSATTLRLHLSPTFLLRVLQCSKETPIFLEAGSAVCQLLGEPTAKRKEEEKN